MAKKQKDRKMTAEEYFREKKGGRRMENEYFIAIDKESLFKMMESFALYKMNEQEIKNAINMATSKEIVDLSQN